MKTGDHVILFVKEPNAGRHRVLKELLIEGDDVFAVTSPSVDPGWPERLRLRPERCEESPMPSGPPGLYVYQDDVLRP